MQMNESFYQSHFVDTPKRIFSAVDRWKPDAKIILDFGCGLGIKTLACAVRYPDSEVIGLDVTRAFEKADLFIDKFLNGRRPKNLRYVQISPGESISSITRPDVIWSWSVLEHVKRALLPDLTRDMRDALREKGIVISQIAPLYHSPFGSHLRAFDPVPWNHLLLSHDEFRQRVIGANGDRSNAVGSPTWMFARYEELNRLTPAELLSYFKEAQFAAKAIDTRKTEEPVPLPLIEAYHEDILRTYEVFTVQAAQ